MLGPLTSLTSLVKDISQLLFSNRKKKNNWSLATSRSDCQYVLESVGHVELYQVDTLLQCAPIFAAVSTFLYLVLVLALYQSTKVFNSFHRQPVMLAVPPIRLIQSIFVHLTVGVWLCGFCKECSDWVGR